MWCHHFRTIAVAAFAATVSGLALLAGASQPAGAASFETVVLSGDPAPGTEGATFGIFSTLVINDRSDIVFSASKLVGHVDSISDDGIFKWSNGSLRPVALTGDTAPGTGGAIMSGLSLSPYRAINNNGDITFGAGLNGDRNDRAIFEESNGTLRLVVRSGDPRPDSDSRTFSGLGVPKLNDNGDILFTTGGNTGLYKESNGTISRIAVEGPIEVGGKSANLVAVIDHASHPVHNNVGDIAFTGVLEGERITAGINEQGIFKKSGSTVSLIARMGDTAPGTAHAEFSLGDGALPTFERIALNDNGDMAFGAFLDNNFYGIFRSTESSGTLDLVARSGDTAPGTDGAFFNTTFCNPCSFGFPKTNDRGDVAFSAEIEGTGVNGTNNFGLFLSPGNGDPMELLLRKGDPFELASGEQLIIANILYYELADDGELAVSLGFTNGTQGIFSSSDLVAPVPIPGSAVLLGTAVLFGGGFAARRRRAAAGGSPDDHQREASNAAD